MTPEEQLDWEADRRPRASAATLVAAVLTLFGGVVAQFAYADFPKDSPDAPRLRVQFIADHAGSILAATIVQAVALALMAVPLVFLFRAARARRPELPAVAQFTALLGPPLFAVTTVLQQVFVAASARDWADGPRYYATAEDALQTDAILAMAALRIAGQLALGFAFVLIALNAMRVGLLTRFMGILGIIAGVLFVLPIGSPVPIVQAFWLGAVAYLISGRWPTGVPPAWETGTAVPWPSQQELREARDSERGVEPPAPSRKPATPEPVAATPEGPVHPSSKKRKRKRRR